MSNVLSTLKSFHRDIQLEEMSEAGRKRTQLNARLQEKMDQQSTLFMSPEERQWHDYYPTLNSANNSADNAQAAGLKVTLTEPCIYYSHAQSKN